MDLIAATEQLPFPKGKGPKFTLRGCLGIETNTARPCQGRTPHCRMHQSSLGQKAPQRHEHNSHLHSFSQKNQTSIQTPPGCSSSSFQRGSTKS